MNMVYIVCVLAVLMHLIFLPAFFWAMKRQRMHGSDEEAFRAVDEEGGATFPPRGALPDALLPMSRVRMVILFGFLITLFVLIMASLVYITVHAPPVPRGAE